MSSIWNDLIERKNVTEASSYDTTIRLTAFTLAMLAEKSENGTQDLSAQFRKAVTIVPFSDSISLLTTTQFEYLSFIAVHLHHNMKQPGTLSVEEIEAWKSAPIEMQYKSLGKASVLVATYIDQHSIYDKLDFKQQQPKRAIAQLLAAHRTPSLCLIYMEIMLALRAWANDGNKNSDEIAAIVTGIGSADIFNSWTQKHDPKSRTSQRLDVWAEDAVCLGIEKLL